MIVEGRSFCLKHYTFTNSKPFLYLTTGKLTLLQFNKSNAHNSTTMQRKQKFPYLVGSKWTAQQKVDGWRHFQVVNRKNQGRWVFAEMVAACDPNVRFWINAKLLKNRSQWQAGWQSLQEIEGS
jgi:tryptophan-rich hypothetical protein